jgi:phage repressor protein C with HTH and peptisase S24 domain
MADTIIDRIQQRLDALKLSERAASIAATGSDGTIRMIRTGRSGNPRGDTLTKLARVLETTEQWLLTGEAAEPTPLPAPASEVRMAPVPVPSGDPKDLPVLGTAAGGELGNGSFQMTTDVIDWVRRPAGLSGAKDAYALYVEGESMSPRFEPGDLVFIHPHRKALSGDYVVIQEPDSNNGEPRAFIKKLVKVTGTTLRVTQFNPPATIDFILRPGLIWHKVMTDGDLYGV